MPSNLICQGLAGIGFGAAMLAMAFLERGPGGEVVRFLGPVAGLLMLGLGAFSLTVGIRRGGRRTRARVVQLADALPTEAGQLGSPMALHQVRALTRLVSIGSGVLLCAAAGVCLALVLSGRMGDSDVAVIALIGWPVGLAMIWHGMKLHGQRFLVFTDGLVILNKGHAAVWRWHDLETVTMKVNADGDVLQRFVLTARRNDGEVLVLTPHGEYRENQLAARLQWAHCACTLPSMQAVLDVGGTLGFGVLKLGPEGIDRDGDFLGWNEIRAAVLEKARVKILGYRRTWEFSTEALPNLMILLALIRNRLAAGQTDETRLALDLRR